MYIKDLHASPPEANNAGQWFNNATGGAHISKTPAFANAGRFSFTKWPHGKYCLTGFTNGLGMACPSEDPAISSYGVTTEVCVEFELTKAPCNIRDDANNCVWEISKAQR